MDLFPHAVGEGRDLDGADLVPVEPLLHRHLGVCGSEKRHPTVESEYGGHSR
jgi:hypothetical protein